MLERKGVVYAIPALAFGTLVLATVAGMTIFSVRDGWRRRRGVAVDALQDRKDSERWMGVGAGIFLAVVIVTAIIVGFEREPIFWTVLLSTLAVMVVMILLDRRRGRESS
ncbi:MAG: hypothetical protein AAGE01_00440 [Pseudomonadota bacterium]